jgi:hypothetical protein
MFLRRDRNRRQEPDCSLTVSKCATISSGLNCNQNFTGNPGKLEIKYTDVFYGKTFVRMRVTV